MKGAETERLPFIFTVPRKISDPKQGLNSFSLLKNIRFQTGFTLVHILYFSRYAMGLALYLYPNL